MPHKMLVVYMRKFCAPFRHLQKVRVPGPLPFGVPLGRWLDSGRAGIELRFTSAHKWLGQYGQMVRQWPVQACVQRNAILDLSADSEWDKLRLMA